MSTAITPNLDSVSLYYKEGSSNKEYHVQIVGNEAEGFKVNFQFGRVGSKLSTGTKTAAPIDYATARKVMERLVTEKQAKGYTTGESGTPYQNTENAGKVSGLLPQLLNFIDEVEVETYINDARWIMQEKKDGVRCMVKKHRKEIVGVNRKGLVVSLPKTVENDIRTMCGEIDAILDGELVGETYWLFDAMAAGVHAFADRGYAERLEEIQNWFSNDLIGLSHVMLVPTAVGKGSKKALYQKLTKENAEGVVFKEKDSSYKAGRPASGGNQVKFKFTAEATVRVRTLNATKASFQMEMLKAGDWVYVGDCTYYPTKYTPKPGDIVEVRYLYAYQNGSLFQPFLKEQRTDVDADACLLSQLKYKQSSTEDE